MTSQVWGLLLITNLVTVGAGYYIGFLIGRYGKK